MIKLNTKIRVKQIGDLYYPQYRHWFIWEYFWKSVGHEYLECVKFGSLEEAIEYAKNKKVKIHEVG